MRSLLVALVTAIVTSMGWLVAFNAGFITPSGAWSEAERDVDATSERTPTDDISAAEDGLDRDDTIRVDPQADPEIRLARSVEVGPSGLAIPVAGISANDLVDTFTAARAGGARRHDAIDIMAETGRPVVSASRGTVEKIYYSEGGGGKTVYIRSPDRRWIYYYAHLDRYARNLREGQRVERGTTLGTVGFSGNASPDGPHLHFAVHRMTAGEDWHEGRPINPYPLLAGEDAEG